MPRPHSQPAPPREPHDPRRAPTEARPEKKRRKKRGASQKGRTKKGSGVPKKRRQIEYVKVPKHWFYDPLLHSMKTVVRPPTAMTRRKELKIEVRVPKEIFFDLVRPLATGDMEKFEWTSAKKVALKPTKEGKSFTTYNYLIKKPEINDKLWRLQEHESSEIMRDKSGTIRPTWRGHGSSRLHLSHAAQERGGKTDLLAAAVGNVMLNLKVPLHERAMPTLTIKGKIATIDGSGHVIWPTNFTANTAAALRKQMRYHLSEMINDPHYPTLTEMRPSLTMSSESVRPEPAARTQPLLLSA